VSPSRLSVILATPPGFNAGMVATELALVAFLRRHGLHSATQCYQLVSMADRLTHLPAHERNVAEQRAQTGIDYRPAFEDRDAIVSSAAVLFWADYLHMGIYLRELEPIVARYPPSEGGDAAHRLKNLLLLADADEATLGRAISFGTTLLFNTLRDEADSSYAVPLRRFLTKAKRVWVRDAFSAAKVAHLRNDYETSHFGVDCALLLTRDDALRNAAERDIATPEKPGSILAFFGRDSAARDGLVQVAMNLGAALGRPVRWLPWGDTGAFPELRPRPDMFAGPEGLSVHELLNEVAHASLVVTDTYHLALTAWNFGVPAVSAFTGHTVRANDVSSGEEFHWRDKREVFFSQYDALDFLIRPEELIDPALLERRTKHLAAVVDDRSLRDAIAARIRAHAVFVEDALARDLSALLGRAPAPAAGGKPVSATARMPKAPSAVAVMCVANEEVHIESALRDLIQDGLDVVLIDHDSDDRTVERARPFLGRGLLSIERLPWTGRFSIAEQLDAKWRVIEQLDHDWIVHVDADEWLGAPAAGQTLLDGLRAADAAGYNAVHFNEFVFVPQPGADVYSTNYRQRSTRYYFFQPRYPYLVRAWKHRSGLDNRPSAGHLVSGPVRLYPIDFPMRHYIALSEEHARRKYVGRAFPEVELARGFHYDRVGLTPDVLRFPSAGDPHMRTLSHWSSKEFDTMDAVTEHFWRWRRTARSHIATAVM